MFLFLCGCASPNSNIKSGAMKGTHIIVYWMPMTTRTLSSYGIDDIKSSYAQKIIVRHCYHKVDSITSLLERIESLENEKLCSKIVPKEANLRLYMELINENKKVLELGVGGGAKYVVINQEVWKDDADFYEKMILEIIERR